MKITKKATFIAITLLMALNVNAQTAKTLAWYGNSFSDAGRVYDQVTRMINCNTCGVTENLTLTLTPYIVPSCWLDCHVANGAFSQIDAGGYDYVVAQSGVPNFLVYGDHTPYAVEYKNWANHAKGAGGTLVIEEMWLLVGQTTPYQGRPEWGIENQTIMDVFCDSIARLTNSILAPCGHAWFYAWQERPELEYVDPNWNDRVHPGRFGAYLNACTFYAALTGKSPVGHTDRTIDFGGSYTLNATDALFAQTKAWEAYQYFNTGTVLKDKKRFSANAQAQTSGMIRAAYNSAAKSIVVTGKNIGEISVVDMKGMTISKDKSTLSRKDLSSYTYNAELQSGAYVVKVKSAGRVTALPLIVN